MSIAEKYKRVADVKHSSRYKGKTPVKRGEKVTIMIADDEYTAFVLDPLATQFTCRIVRQKQIRSYFYSDKGVTWRKIKD